MWDLQVSLHFTCKIWQKSVYLISALCVTDGHTHTHTSTHTQKDQLYYISVMWQINWYKYYKTTSTYIQNTTPQPF